MEIPSSHQELLRCVDDLDLDLHEGLQEVLRLLCCGKKLDGIPHIRATIETFVGPPPRTIPQVCRLNAPMMLRQIIAEVEREPDDSLLKLPGFRRWQFDRGMENAVAAGHLEMVKTLALSFPEYKVSRGVVENAMYYARLEIVQWLYTFRFNGDIEVDATMVAQAVEGGSLEIVKWAYTRCVCKDGLGEAVDVAVGTGRSNILKWLLEYVDTSVDISPAACPGQFHMIEWVLENYPEKCVGAKSVAKSAVRYGKLELGRLLFEHECGGIAFTAQDTDSAAGNGRLDVVKWLLTITTGEGCTTRAMDVAASNGHLEVVKWLHQNRTEGCTTRAMDRAAGNGHLEVVKWLHQNRAEGCTSDAMNTAAGHGHLNVVKWLHLNRTEGCTSDAMDSAASGGHLDVVKWLHRNRMEGCTARAMDKAAKYGHLEVVQWLHSNRQEGCTTRAVDCAAENGFLEIIKWLIENRSEGCSTHAMELAAESGRLHVVQWLHDNRTDARICMAAFENAASYGHFAVVTWLHKNGYEVYPGQTVEISVRTGHFDIEFFTGLERDDDVSMANALSSGSVHNRGLL